MQLNDDLALSQIPGYSELGKRSRTALETANIALFGDLREINKDRLAGVKNCGAKAITEIMEWKTSLSNGTTKKKSKSVKSKLGRIGVFMILEHIIEVIDDNNMDTGFLALRHDRVMSVEQGIQEHAMILYDGANGGENWKVTAGPREVLEMIDTIAKESK